MRKVVRSNRESFSFAEQSIVNVAEKRVSNNNSFSFVEILWGWLAMQSISKVAEKQEPKRPTADQRDGGKNFCHQIVSLILFMASTKTTITLNYYYYPVLPYQPPPPPPSYTTSAS